MDQRVQQGLAVLSAVALWAAVWAAAWAAAWGMVLAGL